MLSISSGFPGAVYRYPGGTVANDFSGNVRSEHPPDGNLSGQWSGAALSLLILAFANTWIL